MKKVRMKIFARKQSRIDDSLHSSERGLKEREKRSFFLKGKEERMETKMAI